MASQFLTSLCFATAILGFSISNSIACDFDIRGLISEVTTEETAKFIESAPSHATICFHSNGGSLVEGVKILKLLRSTPKSIQTRVPRDSACLSACALAFMGGKRQLQEEYFQPWRLVERGAKLGFHMPYFLLTHAIDSKAAEEMFGIVISVYDQLTALTDFIPDNKYTNNSGADDDYNFAYREFYHTFPASLLDKMNAVEGRSEFYYIEDEFQAIRYGIRIIDTDKPLRLESIGDLWNIVRLHEASFARRSIELGESVKYGQKIYRGLEVYKRKFKGHLYFDVSITNDISSKNKMSFNNEPHYSAQPSKRDGGDHWYIFPELESRRVLIFESMSFEGDLTQGVEQWRHYINSPFNRIYLY